MKSTGIVHVAVAFLVAVVIAVAWGSVVQTQYNLAALATIGADIGPVRMNATLRDLFSGFFPTYGGYIVLPALLVAFGIAEFLSRRYLPGWRLALFGLVGFISIFLAIPLVNKLSPVALLVGATRDWGCTFWMSVAGIVSGLVFAWMTRIAARQHRQPAMTPQVVPAE